MTDGYLGVFQDLLRIVIAHSKKRLYFLIQLQNHLIFSLKKTADIAQPITMSELYTTAKSSRRSTYPSYTHSSTYLQCMHDLALMVISLPQDSITILEGHTFIYNYDIKTMSVKWFVFIRPWPSIFTHSLYTVPWRNILVTLTRRSLLHVEYDAYASAQMVGI